jgi:predicted GH43/DUF377 family glycosyl hydrolase/lysophospholipase L1-like esterase
MSIALCCLFLTAGAQIADVTTFLNPVKEAMRIEWPENRTINLVFHGHSVPSGYFVTPDVRTMQAYPHLTLQKVKDGYPYAVVNSIVTAIGGEQSEQGAARFASDVLTHHPDVLFIDYALNDRSIGLDRALKAWEAMLSQATAQNIKVMLMTPTPDQSVDILDDNSPLAQHAAQIRGLAAKYHTGLVDSYAAFKAAVQNGGALKDYMSQINHPNEKGHQLVADMTEKWFIDQTQVQPQSPKQKWEKYSGNPVLGGGDLGTIFDISVLKDGDEYLMYNSWRPKKSIALSVSSDGVNWTPPQPILPPNSKTDWENDINRVSVLKKDGIFHMWYTGQADGHSWIGYATSSDGINFTRKSNKPVLSPELPWEKVAVMCPHVNWDEKERIFKMWYSGGEQYEPNAIGYATSKDGLTWKKYSANPIFSADPANEWEKHKVTACQVIKRDNDYLMFYIGFRTEDIAQIGMAKSPDGITGWTRYSANPTIAPTPGSWDASACYKPFAIKEQNRWLLWYNGRNGDLETIGLAIYNSPDLDF